MNVKHKKTLVGSIASLALIGGVAATGVAAANAANGTDSSSSSHSKKGEPNEAKIHGSISVSESTHEESDAAEATKLAKLATVDKKAANAAALATVAGGSIVESSLDEEDGSLVYDVTVKDGSGATTEVIIDAGNAKVLASETEASDAHEGTEGPEGKNGGSDGETNDAPPASPTATNGK